ncbi:hypothetical protein [Leifsonia sp. SIMBA_070]|uniref:hypothetical protein n=1 Tax=Leifsonia sp. SIMBA_070 TaxID=3085810 RepID=UPI00397CE004
MTPYEAAGLLGVAPTATPDDVQRAYQARLVEAGSDPRRRDELTAARDALLAASGWAPAPWYPPAPPRRGLSTGAIVGITLGSMAAGLVVLLFALFGIAAIAHDAGRLADSRSSSSAAPYADPTAPDPSAPDSAAPDDSGSSVEDYDVDGVHVHYVDGWTFELTPARTCAGATVTAGFSDTPDGDEVDQWTTTLDLEAGVPATVTIPDSASPHDYAGIDAVDCGQA